MSGATLAQRAAGSTATSPTPSGSSGDIADPADLADPADPPVAGSSADGAGRAAGSGLSPGPPCPEDTGVGGGAESPTGEVARSGETLVVASSTSDAEGAGVAAGSSVTGRSGVAGVDPSAPGPGANHDRVAGRGAGRSGSWSDDVLMSRPLPAGDEFDAGRPGRPVAMPHGGVVGRRHGGMLGAGPRPLGAPRPGTSDSADRAEAVRRGGEVVLGGGELGAGVAVDGGGGAGRARERAGRGRGGHREGTRGRPGVRAGAGVRRRCRPELDLARGPPPGAAAGPGAGSGSRVRPLLGSPWRRLGGRRRHRGCRPDADRGAGRPGRPSVGRSVLVRLLADRLLGHRERARSRLARPTPRPPPSPQRAHATQRSRRIDPGRVGCEGGAQRAP